MNMPQIEYLGCKKATDQSGNPLAKSNYFFDVDGRQVTVEVHATVSNFFLAPGSRDRLVSEREIREACEELIKSRGKSDLLVLDEYVAESLGLKDRRLTATHPSF